MGVAICIIAVPLIATEHQTAEWVFTKFFTDLGESSGITNPVSVAFWVAATGAAASAVPSECGCRAGEGGRRGHGSWGAVFGSRRSQRPAQAVQALIGVGAVQEPHQ